MKTYTLDENTLQLICCYIWDAANAAQTAETALEKGTREVHWLDEERINLNPETGGWKSWHANHLRTARDYSELELQKIREAERMVEKHCNCEEKIYLLDTQRIQLINQLEWIKTELLPVAEKVEKAYQEKEQKKWEDVLNGTNKI